MSKFKMEMVPDENGKMVSKWIPIEHENDDAPENGCVYGDYLKTDAAHMKEAKARLLENMFDVIRKMALNDNFWIVKPTGDGQITVGWKIEIPQMAEAKVSNMEDNKDIPVLSLWVK